MSVHAIMVLQSFFRVLDDTSSTILLEDVSSLKTDTSEDDGFSALIPVELIANSSSASLSTSYSTSAVTSMPDVENINFMFIDVFPSLNREIQKINSHKGGGPSSDELDLAEEACEEAYSEKAVVDKIKTEVINKYKKIQCFVQSHFFEFF